MERITKQFKLLAVQQDRTTQALLVEAINDLLAKYGLNCIADEQFYPDWGKLGKSSLLCTLWSVVGHLDAMRYDSHLSPRRANFSYTAVRRVPAGGSGPCNAQPL
jgi:hypothetical protein